jgi:hypothetical protein
MYVLTLCANHASQNALAPAHRIATVSVAKWTGELHMERMQRILSSETPEEAEEPESVLDQVEKHMPQTGRTGLPVGELSSIERLK